MDFGFGGTEVLQQAEVGFALRVESYELAVEYGVVGKFLECRGDVVKFAVEDVAAAGEEGGRAIFF